MEYRDAHNTWIKESGSKLNYSRFFYIICCQKITQLVSKMLYTCICICYGLVALNMINKLYCIDSVPFQCLFVCRNLNKNIGKIMKTIFQVKENHNDPEFFDT